MDILQDNSLSKSSDLEDQFSFNKSTCYFLKLPALWYLPKPIQSKMCRGGPDTGYFKKFPVGELLGWIMLPLLIYDRVSCLRSEITQFFMTQLTCGLSETWLVSTCINICNHWAEPTSRGERQESKSWSAWFPSAVPVVSSELVAWWRDLTNIIEWTNEGNRYCILHWCSLKTPTGPTQGNTPGRLSVCHFVSFIPQ